MVTVLFDSRAAFLERQSFIHFYLQENNRYNIRPVSVFHDHLAFGRFKYLKNVELLSNYWKEGSKRYSFSELIEIEKKYNKVNLWHIIASDRFIKLWKQDEIVKQISFYFYAWETIIEKYKPDYIVSETVTGLWNYSLFLICQERNIKYLSIQTTKNTGRYYYSYDQHGSWKEFETRYIELLKRGLNAVQVSETKEFIGRFMDKQMIPPYMKSSTSLPNYIKFINLPRFIINIKKDIVQNWFYSNHDYKLGYRLFDYIFTFIRSKRIIQARLANLFEQPDNKNKYILFPVHYQPEATTDIWAPYYSDQISTIKNIARSLPFGYYLYVKEHAALLGSKPIGFYKEIKKIPNVRLIDPWAKISDLIRNASAVSVITGTTGLESIIWNKPVILFGNVFYSIYPYINKVTNLELLPGLIRASVSQEIEPDDPKRLAFIYLYSTMGYNSDIYKYRPDNNAIVRFAEELIEEISKN